MPITVEKSSLIEFNDKLENALTSMTQQLEKQPNEVKSVTLLANFSIDSLATLQHGTTILQGLVVQVTPEYKLGPADMSWFHPDIASGRSVFRVEQFISKSTLASIELDGIQSSVGSYTTSKPDEFGCESVQHHIVVDIDASEMLGSLYQKWISTGQTAGEVDKQWKRMQFDKAYGVKEATTLVRKEIAFKIQAGVEEIYTDTVRDILSDTNSVYFTNSAVKTNDAQILVKSSALGGYRMYGATNTGIRFYPATLGTMNEYYSFKAMSRQNCARIEKSCAWGGELEFNAMVMSKPAITGARIRSLEDEYEMSFRDIFSMNTAAFSPSDSIHDLLAPSDLHNLHPDEGVQNAKAYITAPVDMNHPVLQHIMTNIQQIGQQFPNFQLFNPKIMLAGRIKVPKKLFKQIQ
jgi:hypothetical protein